VHSLSQGEPVFISALKKHRFETDFTTQIRSEVDAGDADAELEVACRMHYEESTALGSDGSDDDMQ